MSHSPDNFDDVLSAPRSAGAPANGNAAGIEANISCGSWIRFTLRIEHGRISDIGYETSGCSQMVIAAEIVSGKLRGQELSELQGLDRGILGEVGRMAAAGGRQGCAETVLSALRKGLADYRETLLAVSGDLALACTCFGVTIDAIENAVRNGAFCVEQVAARCRAGSGCGSCRLLIQEIIDHAQVEFSTE